jgi:hypothetical protein
MAFCGVFAAVFPSWDGVSAGRAPGASSGISGICRVDWTIPGRRGGSEDVGENYGSGDVTILPRLLRTVQ